MTYWFVHEAKGDLVVVLVLSCDLRPETRKLGVGRTTLANDRTVPTSIIVNVNNAKRGASVQAALNLLIIGRKVVGVKVAAEVVVEEILPSYGESESVQAVIVDEVLHLIDAKLTGIDNACRFASTIDGAAEVETCDL